MTARHGAANAQEAGRGLFERRRRMRFDITVPVRLLRIASLPVSLPGRTVNVSSSGLLLASGVPLEVGAGVEFEVELFSDESARILVRLKCRGAVVRTEPSVAEKPARAGLRLLEYEFVRQLLGGRRQIRL